MSAFTSTAAATLARFGVDPQRVARAQAAIPPGEFGAALADLVAGAPDPVLALANWERAAQWPEAVAVVASWPAARWPPLFTLLGGSQVLSATLLSAAAAWPESFAAVLTAGAVAAREHIGALAAAVSAPWEEFAGVLRRYRSREYLRIGLSDLTGGVELEATLADLTALAEGVCEAAYRWARHAVAADFGALSRPDGRPNGFVVLAMGKFGGGELNYSSDIDLTYLYESDQGESAGGPRGRLTAAAFFIRVAELITRALQERTDTGFAFRVDLRLRPEGINGPITNSVDNALLYYESWGQTWERTALIQARPVAGDHAVGQRFLREVQPFVYRRYLDFATVADMKELKSRIEQQLGHKTRGNVKLGRGGIREIEFVVQALQLIHGGRDERLRGSGTLPGLQRLVAGGVLPAPEGQELAVAYRFLRQVEHKIQIVHERQTHSVPAGEAEQETLARRLGLANAPALWAALEAHRAPVRRAFEQLFYAPQAEVQRARAPELVALVDGLEDAALAQGELGRLGFADPEASHRDLILLRDGSPSAPARPGRKKALRELAPVLLQAVVQSANPDQALHNLATFITNIGARTSFLALLRENPATLQMLVRLFAGSEFLAQAFLRRPEMLDSLVRADLVRVRVPKAALVEELGRQLAPCADFEAALDVLRRFRNEHFLRIGINDLEQLLALEDVSSELTALAESCLEAAYDIAVAAVREKFGRAAPPGQFVIVALGKLGSGELNYNSDLDLIFIYEAGEEAIAHEFFSKLAQRLLTVLQVPTTEGLVYRIDTRLRPSGRAGPLVSSLESFRRYHEQSARLWERQALIKARAVAGDAALAAAVAPIIADFVYRRPLAEAEVREMVHLRGRMERELARESAQQVNIKTGRGGLVDIEFVTQMLQLRHGSTHSAVRVRATLTALAALQSAGVLPAADAELLQSGYRFLRRLENRLRLAHDQPVEVLDRGGIDLGPLARQLGLGGATATPAAAAEALWREYGERREGIRACYEKWFGSSPAVTPGDDEAR
ncbi:MAG: bifunctional [glutamate--ammonia ligase]-adenylyl-L-tyrosine phosphorylase/[glutamate--ammonia-ligase] adenylyltransferase [Deltaproteobacteria bacterium]|nr:bifunctional [glutamate--ammonia ligase]-adenylyl-L-tyrosine phosphorylase/[glutamate--ammonia-ligase] adenylyltransferase [Deltaproteobacteria bacterium]